MGMRKADNEKEAWSGRLISIQPRIQLMRSFDKRTHSYHGYVLRINGTCGDRIGEFQIAVGKAMHAKHQFCTGMDVSGLAVPVPDPRLETAEFYKTSGVIVAEKDEEESHVTPPYWGVPPNLKTYRSRGHRQLDAKTYHSKCTACIWGCLMPVEIIIDHWNPSNKRYRFETFCYGPKICSFYRAGVARKVPGRKGMSYTEEDWIDEDATARRGLYD
jgi:hypothetical protein